MNFGDVYAVIVSASDDGSIAVFDVGAAEIFYELGSLPWVGVVSRRVATNWPAGRNLLSALFVDPA